MNIYCVCLANAAVSRDIQSTSVMNNKDSYSMRYSFVLRQKTIYFYAMADWFTNDSTAMTILGAYRPQNYTSLRQCG